MSFLKKSQNRKIFYGQLDRALYLAPRREFNPDGLTHKAELPRSLASLQGDNPGNNCLFEEREDLSRPFRIGRNLPGALERKEISLKYQPRINCRGEIVAVESLLRWNHREMGCIPPEEFIPLAESSGEIIPLGEWALRETCRQARKWMDRGINLPISVNISPVQIHQLSAPLLVREILNETGLPPERLELEVTENTMLNREEGTIRSLRELNSMGIRIALDDFGTGFSSLSYLGSFPIDILKIDQSFIRDIERNGDHRTVVEAITFLARSFGCRLIAEGVETEEQLLILKQMGCHEFQGFYYHQPLSAEELEGLYAVGSPAT